MAQAPAAAPEKALTPAEVLEKIGEVDHSTQDVTADPNGGRKAAGGSKGAAPGQQMQGPTVITALDTDFQQKQHVAIFTNNVVVNNETFNLICDKLTAYLHHGDTARPDGSGTAPAPATPPPAAPAAGKNKMPVPQQSSALDRAVAEGACQIIQDKVDDNGNITHSIGHGKIITYDAATGIVKLYGKPDVQQGDNLCVATDDSTYMVMDRAGHMEAFGPHRTLIKETAKADGKTDAK
jgi:lipopolysaccharide export system protein LptA